MGTKAKGTSDLNANIKDDEDRERTAQSRKLVIIFME